jgi:hypothetical protein
MQQPSHPPAFNLAQFLRQLDYIDDPLYTYYYHDKEAPLRTRIPKKYR